MKLLVLPIILISFSSHSMSDDILKVREWTSTEGVKLKAELVKRNGDTVTLKRDKDGKEFDLDISKLSLTDTNLLGLAADKIDQIASDPNYTGYSEYDWYLAYRLGKLDLLWDSTTAISNKIRFRTSFVLVKPNKFQRETDEKYFVIGDHIVLRLVVPLGKKINIAGEHLVVVEPGDSSYGKEKILQINNDYKIFICNMDKCAPEKIGVKEYLVFTYKLGRDKAIRF